MQGMSLGTEYMTLAALVLSGASLILSFIFYARQQRLLRRYRQLLNGQADTDLEGILLAQGGAQEALEGEIKTLERRVASLEVHVLKTVHRFAVVRFNAFPDTGSDQSFAIALLDASNNGVVISSLYGRTESRTYAKPIKEGTSVYALTDEERQAIAKAIEGHK